MRPPKTSIRGRCVAPPSRFDRFAQGAVGGEQVHILEQGRLIGAVTGRAVSVGHCEMSSPTIITQGDERAVPYHGLYINLDRSAGRRENFERQLAAAGHGAVLCALSAIEGAKLSTARIRAARRRDRLLLLSLPRAGSGALETCRSTSWKTMPCCPRTFNP